MNNIGKGEVFGIITRYVTEILLVLGGIYFLLWVLKPFYKIAGESISEINNAFRFGSGKDLHSLAVLCILVIGIIGLAKILTRRG